MHASAKLDRSGATNHRVSARHDDTVTNLTDPDPEVPERTRPPRRFPADYMTRMLAENDHLFKAAKDARLRREGLYSSMLAEWRRQRAHCGTEALRRPAGRRPADARDKEKITKLKKRRGCHAPHEPVPQDNATSVQSTPPTAMGSPHRGNGNGSPALHNRRTQHHSVLPDARCRPPSSRTGDVHPTLDSKCLRVQSSCQGGILER